MCIITFALCFILIGAIFIIYKKQRKPKVYPDGIMIKFGKKKHLKQIVKNRIRFSPSQEYIKIEQNQHNHGQGDLLEGKWKIYAESLKVFDSVTHNYIGSINHKAEFTVSIQDVNDMPVFCLSHYKENAITNGKLVLDNEDIENIKRDFSDATHALIILEPRLFVNSLIKTIGHELVYDDVHYFDYDINDLRMLMFLSTGDESIEPKPPFFSSENYNERYRHLLCKDDDFAHQKEFRFIILDELIKAPNFYDYKYHSKYIIVPISKLSKPLKL